ncbi:MIT domain-containing protein 1-like [Leptopilina boulardi]|uniref:MIT domain-containing protein 1-like n=1 Tax=Leptopilina boulardi TaxID=63433 RepID=UPI0021F538BD|nr:MIT domain-containing protein 1-like [Leptopilina boulardi]
MENAAANILQRAVEMDKKEQYTMALVLYQEGLEILVNSIKETTDQTKKKHFQGRASQYMDRAERIKSLIEDRKSRGKYREQIKIENGSSGYGYGSVFGRFLDASVTQIQIEDPYIRSFHQCQNLVRFCELAVQKCHSLTKINLITTRDSTEDVKNQFARLDELGKSLLKRSINLLIDYSETLHDRRITLSNGWVIKIGRGLDYFKAPDGKFSLGACDLELRSCLETIVDIYHQSHLQDSVN